jgi:hypothetical protein
MVVCRRMQIFPTPGVHTCHLAPDSMPLLLSAGFKVGELRLFGSARSAGREVDTKFGKVQPSTDNHHRDLYLGS